MGSKQQTALKWLKSNLPSLFIDDSGHYQELFKQAIQMEREQIHKAFDAGSAYAIGSHADFKQTHPNKEQYYEQTYGTDKN